MALSEFQQKFLADTKVSEMDATLIGEIELSVKQSQDRIQTKVKELQSKQK